MISLNSFVLLLLLLLLRCIKRKQNAASLLNNNIPVKFNFLPIRLERIWKDIKPSDCSTASGIVLFFCK